jgi:hypothetical protein
MIIIKKTWATLFLVVLMVATFSTEARATAFSKEILVFEQRTALLKHHPNIKDGETGHVLYFEGELYFKDGKRAGILYGSTVAIDIKDSDSNPEIRHRDLIFVIDNSQILSSGISGYERGPKWKVEGREWLHLDLAIVGGTGQYIGVFGSVKTIKLKNNIFQHTLEMYKPNLQ